MKTVLILLAIIPQCWVTAEAQAGVMREDALATQIFRHGFGTFNQGSFREIHGLPIPPDEGPLPARTPPHFNPAPHHGPNIPKALIKLLTLPTKIGFNNGVKKTEFQPISTQHVVTNVAVVVNVEGKGMRMAPPDVDYDAKELMAADSAGTPTFNVKIANTKPKNEMMQTQNGVYPYLLQ